MIKRVSNLLARTKSNTTPKDEEVKLKIGEAFDVTAEGFNRFRQITSASMKPRGGYLRNHKDKDVSVGIIER